MHLRKPIRKTAAALLAAVILITLIPTPAFAAGNVVLGDLNGNGTVDPADARIALRLSLGVQYILNDNYMASYVKVGDLNGSGAIEPADARLILRLGLGLEPGYKGKTVSDALYPYAGRATDLPTEMPAAPDVNAKHGTFTFVKYGNGHALGLSQWGAIILSDYGIPYDHILAHYFKDSVLVQETAPATSVYCGVSYSTLDLVARIAASEIGVSSKDEAIKAQAVCAYTQLKRYNYNVPYAEYYQVGSRYTDALPERIRNAVSGVLGKYLARKDDAAKKPLLAVYSAMAAGHTLNCNQVWYADYPVSVSSPFEGSLDNFISYWSCSTADMEAEIGRMASRAGVGKINLSTNPAEWIQILAHDGSIDKDRGYVTKIKIGDKVFEGIGKIQSIVDISTGCFTVVYTP